MNDLRRSLVVRVGMLGVVVTGLTCGKDPVPPENRRPVAVGSMPDTTLVEGDVYTRNVAEYFNDPDDDDLNYTALSSNASVATASAAGETMTVRAVAEGTATVTVTATDEDGLSATQDFEVTVERPNQRPVVVVQIPDLTLTEGDTTRVDVSGVFNDPDGDALVFTAVSDAPGTATAAVDGTEVAVAGIAPGATTVVVTATDPEGLAVADTFAVTVEKRNEAPVAVGEVPPVDMVEGEEFTATVSQFFHDPDDDELTYTAEPSDTAVVTTSMASDTITVTAVAPGMATITVTATDPEGLFATQTAEFTVEKANRAPVIADTIGHQTLNTGETLVLDVSKNFTDPDGDTLVYTAESDDAGVATVEVDGSEVTIAGIGVGSAIVTVTATDPGGLSVSQAFAANVEENRAPEISDSIAARTLDEGDSATLDLDDHFTDPDGDTLVYEASSGDTSVATVAVDGSELTIAGVAEGSATLTVTATDPDGLSAMQSFAATVETPNRAPEPVDEISPVTMTEGERSTSDVSRYFVDPDGDELVYTAKSSDGGVATVAVLGDSLIADAVDAGTATVTVTATDPDGLSATQTAEFTVKPPNQAPRAVGEFAEQSLVRGDTIKLDVSDKFMDPDGDTLTYKASSSDDAIVTAGTDGDTVVIVGTGKGKATVTVTATDPEGLSATQEISVLAGAPRAVRKIPGIGLAVDDTARVDVSDYFEDPDDDELVYSVVSSKRSIARASVSGSTVSVEARAAGRVTVTVTATDPQDLSATQEFRVAVASPLPLHDVFVVVDTAGDVDTLSSVSLDMAGYFGDTDSVFDYEAEVGRDTVAEIESVKATVVTLEPLVVDTAVLNDTVLFDTTTISVTATDDDGLSVMQEAMVRVAPVDYEAWALIEITDEGKVKAGLLTLSDCFELNGFTWGDSVYTVHWSEWQVRKGSGWVRLPGTYAELEVCSYDDLPDEDPGIYRFVGEASVWTADTTDRDTVRDLRRADNTIEIEDNGPPPPWDLSSAPEPAQGPAGAGAPRPRVTAAPAPHRRSARRRPGRRSRRGCSGRACARTSSARPPSARRARYRRR